MSAPATVYSGQRDLAAPALTLPDGLQPDTRLKMDGLEFLSCLVHGTIPVAFFDPQYRGVLDKLQYGNEGEQRGKRRSSLQQMTEETIAEFIRAIDSVLIPSGHLFLWMDKFHLCQGFKHWLGGTQLDIVDLVNWDKGKIGMGYRSRRKTEHCVVLQKRPRRAKGVWKDHTIPDTWPEKAEAGSHAHAKPIGLQRKLISAVTNEGDYVVDPAAGSFSVLEAAMRENRTFLGCDLNG